MLFEMLWQDAEEPSSVWDPSGGEGGGPKAGAVARQPDPYRGVRAGEVRPDQVRPEVRQLPDH